MRVGSNPNKIVQQETQHYTHHVVIPVYIPNHEGYFAESLGVLKLCLDSLIATVHSKTFISIIDNGSATEVKQYLYKLYSDHVIHELIHTDNIGKFNAIVKGLSGHNFPLVTISDADVLFLSHWQKETYEVFNNFPKAGVVGITPQFKMFGGHCENLIFEKLFSNQLHFATVKNPNALEKFYESIGWDKNFNPNWLKTTLAITNKKGTALVGSGHFVATYKTEIFNEMRIYQSAKMGGEALAYIDTLPLKKGFWRLTTQDNFAYHMGNVVEDWMKIEVGNLIKNDDIFSCKVNLGGNQPNISSLENFVKNRVFRKIFSNKKMRRMFYRLKHLPSAIVRKY